jgi:hypothetical protein
MMTFSSCSACYLFYDVAYVTVHSLMALHIFFYNWLTDSREASGFFRRLSLAKFCYLYTKGFVTPLLGTTLNFVA